jgi:2-hydroxychromene-2-carboxylate isomerase
VARQLARDRRFDDALAWAQAIDPEGGDPRWAYLVIRTQLLLMAVDRLRWRLYELHALSERGRQAWAEAASSDSPVVRETQARYARAVRGGCRAGEQLLVAVRVLPPMLAALALTGSHDPLGRMTSTRFALMEADRQLAENCARRALPLLREAARELAQAESTRLGLALDRLAAGADARQQAIYEGLAAARLGMSADEVRAACAEQRGLGAACRAAAARGAHGSATGEPTYEQAESVRIVIQLLTRELRAERIGRRE